ncbi:single-stranded DNA-binding protein [Pelomonas aquatica]|uniref:Single-stranded DNA-binding protein n=1 Tax=Pelomonas aquatica TaxID=431058 RepID=A0A9X4R6D8_9BURK|nr:single-stranded DNA-binding protein [Pelomonas aquatica]MCY4754892.1 single-stranded DNA-binding protein [Pelomonas aquatica]MDG0865377.1 single-stranded DNA-binding protein [Pelomonas aquatica]
MANIQVIQRSAHLAGNVKCEQVAGRSGPITKGTFVAISNSHRGSSDSREVQATAITWTLWGKQAEDAAAYLTRGSHVNVIGRMSHNNYLRNEETVYGWDFIADEIDYLDTQAETAARRHAVRAGSAQPAPEHVGA